ncbi:unnamed protein product [Prunus brigantina]
MYNGNFMQKDPNDALEFLDEIAEKAHQWTVPSPVSPIEGMDRSRIATSSTNKGIYQLNEEDDWKLKFEVLTKEIAALKMEKSNLPQPVYQQHKQNQRRPYEDDECAVVNLIEALVQDQFEKTSISEPLESLLLNSKEFELLEDPEIADHNSLLNSL